MAYKLRLIYEYILASTLTHDYHQPG